ncbi:MAG: hypothetical protein Ct9H300mP25_03060 [Acidobacteriota bacterium]|nr:MAG: hypothetical protein Ct9H300mP25_03060 [Acidobacteriota bacterium]
MPQQLLDKVVETAAFNQGFATTEYLAASLLDQAWHQLTADQVPDPQNVETFEAGALQDAGVGLATIPPRYRSAYFSHIWGSGYSAGYYSYIWAEVLDADSVEWFRENGGLRRENGTIFVARYCRRAEVSTRWNSFERFEVESRISSRFSFVAASTSRIAKP